MPRLVVTRDYPATREGVAQWHLDEGAAEIARAANWRAAAEASTFGDGRANPVRRERLFACVDAALAAARFHMALADIILTDAPE